MEMFEIVDDEDRVIGLRPRAECHGNPALVHRVAHVLIVDGQGRLLLQKRSQNKDIQPGKWDTSVGGHLDPGEDYLAAARREMAEELGLEGLPLTLLYQSRIRNEIESENVATYLARHCGGVQPNPTEIDEVRYWAAAEIEAALGTGVLTPNFEQEWSAYQRWCRRSSSAGSGPLLCGGDSFPDLIARMEQE